ncbi:DHA2 family efflux MFS transporter permease subunit [Rhodoligotrophos defluvii]|uniref:DHA2 family efflux MFS transporter permease subunit n=1 Tax=Rhodoligotrophos defluvii TaxID=2561934 RepID=UPI0010C9A651|nr:DHA2 family efflux MFS transporter permease subunit [Rhodoligotrophos defluvii]
MPRQRLIALIVACALFMQNLDSTVLGTALPAIGNSFGVHPLNLHLAMTAYLLSLAVFMPISGWMADRFGARRVFCYAVCLFTFSSIACGLAPNVGTLIAARVLQGIGGAMMVPVARLVLVKNVPKAELVGAMAWVTMPALVGPVVGPLVGGFLVTYASWHWIFWINVPFGLIAITMALTFIPEMREQSVPPLDIGGFLLSGIAVAGLVFGLENIGDGAMPLHLSLASAAIGAIMLGAYIYHALHRENPIINLRLLRYSTFRASILGGSLFRIGVGALPFLLPLLMQVGFGKSALESGAVTFAAAAGALVMKAGVGRVLSEWGFRNVLIWNAWACGISMAACALFTPSTPYWVMVAVLLVGGVFRSLQFTALNTIAFADLPQRALSNATGFISMAQQLSLSLGIALGAALLQLAVLYTGGPVTTEEFIPAFVAVGMISALSALTFMRLHQDAGAEISGRVVEAAGHAGAMGGTAPPPVSPRKGTLHE